MYLHCWVQQVHQHLTLLQISMTSIFLKLNRHNYSNPLSQSSHCTPSSSPSSSLSPPLQAPALYVSRTLYNSRHGGSTIVYRKKGCNFSILSLMRFGILLAPQRISRGRTQGRSWEHHSTELNTQLPWFSFGGFSPWDSLLYTYLHRDYPIFIPACLI